MTTSSSSGPFSALGNPLGTPVRWFLLECAHYGDGGGTLPSPGARLNCEVCGQPRRVVHRVVRRITSDSA